VRSSRRVSYPFAVPIGGRFGRAIKAALAGSLVVLSMAVPSGPARAAEAKAPDLARGARLFKKCIHCHTVNREGKHRIGPNLHGLFGRKAGTIAGFDFSPAWRNANFVWTEKMLDTYLRSPRQTIPNNLMQFDGFNRAEDRAALIAYLKVITR
jgi:cytochrome c